jgi:hypothetical protein
VQNFLSSGLLSKNTKIKIYRTKILPVIVYGCEISSLTLRGERRPEVFENRVLRRILHNEELNDLYSSPNITRVINSSRLGRGAYRVFGAET